MHLIHLLAFTFGATHAFSYQLNKCCSPDQIFDTDLECVDINNDLNQTDFWWIPPEIRLNLNTSEKNEMISNGNSKPICAENSQEFLVHNGNNGVVEFDLKIINNEIILEVLKKEAKHVAKFSSESYCIDAVQTEVFAVLVCPCVTMRCVFKCCGEGELYNETESSCQEDEGGSGMVGLRDWAPESEVGDEAAEYYLLSSKQPECQEHEFHSIHTITHTAGQAGSRKSKFVLLNDGSIKDTETDSEFPADEYCGDNTVDGHEVVYFCIKTDSVTEAVSQLYGVLFLVSAVALLVTVVVTAACKELRQNNFNKMALVHNVMLLVAFATTGIVQLSGHTLSNVTCTITSFTIEFTMLAAFFWLNVMSIDVACMFSGVLRSDSKRRSDRMFHWYSLYAWGGTFLITLATVIFEYSPEITSFKPNFGTAMCFFNDFGATLLFFYGPIAVILLINTVLMIYTGVQILWLASPNEENDDKQKLTLFVKLFILMGGTWVFEVLSWAIGGESYYWIFTDILNLLRGVFIFIIFCCKRSVYNLVRDKLMRMCGKKAVLIESKYSSVLELANMGAEVTEVKI